ncbi:hypothetical protein RN001_007826 [Aquatica leii]|uniref:NodB homology domain-containing protein n=1 Tax=Aquatica leii TaxID=1421715 RepID=A0AAN7Q4M5_9COLE|nr:hypothetical protein RN001_007826 [Aquatica leii]
MKRLLVLLFLTSAFAFSVYEAAETCGEQCKRENDCACGSVTSPIAISSTPQFVTLTFDDSATALNYDQYYEKLLFDRKNPDGKPISATFYVPHEYTDYGVVNKLYNKGFEIGTHSVTKQEVEYWKNATKDQLTLEFSDSKQIISKFANIAIDDILGARTPHFQISGDNTVGAYVAAKLKYDSSFVTLSSNPVFPFTLEYNMNDPCTIGECPTESYPGFWLLPIINLKRTSNIDCNALTTCEIKGSAEEIKNWFVEQFNRFYTSNRAPMTLLLNSVWFQLVENSYAGFELFLNYLGTQKDVFLVSHSEVIAWSRKPVAINDYKTNHKTNSQSCLNLPCRLNFEQIQQERMMTSCVPCPKKYPWIGNPNGN